MTQRRTTTTGRMPARQRRPSYRASMSMPRRRAQRQSIFYNMYDANNIDLFGPIDRDDESSTVETTEHLKLHSIESGDMDDNANVYGSIDSSGGDESALQIDKGGSRKKADALRSIFSSTLKSLPGIAIVSALQLMFAIPFGAGYFANIGTFQGLACQSLGMRLCLLSVAISQVVLGCTGLSTFDYIVPAQMAALTPFYNHFGNIATTIAQSAYSDSSGHGFEPYILPTTLYLISLSTIIAGVSYYVVGIFGMGKVTSFFPRYTLLGITGGVGVYVMILSILVSVGAESAGVSLIAITYGWDIKFLTTALFVAGLRMFRAITPSGRVVFLDSVYFFGIPLIFYAGMCSMGISFDKGVQLGFFFMDNSYADKVEGTHAAVSAFIGWNHMGFSHICWGAAIPAMTSFLSLSITSIMLGASFPPIIALRLDAESKFDMDQEFKMHGYANVVVGALLPGGLFMYECFPAVMLKKTGAAGGKVCSALQAITVLLFAVYGYYIVDYVPRCMAGTLLFDFGLNLIISAVTVTEFTFFEYSSVWAILVVMTMTNMTTALIAGLVLSLFNYTQQSFEDNPLHTACDISRIPSPCMRREEALRVLDLDPLNGRRTVIVFKLRGNLFYGNIPKLKEEILKFLNERKELVNIAIIDLDMVMGIDSSASVLMEKFFDDLKEERGIETVLVSVSHFDPELSASLFVMDDQFEIRGKYYKHCDDALIACEDTLLRRHKPGLEDKYTDTIQYKQIEAKEASLECEYEVVRMLMSQYNTGHAALLQYSLVEQLDAPALASFLKVLKRESYAKGDHLWREGCVASSAKILLRGSFLAVSSEYFSGPVPVGSVVGLHTLLLGELHHINLQCDSDDGLAYALDIEAYKELCDKDPEAARMIDMYMARSLSWRLESMTHKAGIGRGIFRL